jgi:virginiamycin B lyase
MSLRRHFIALASIGLLLLALAASAVAATPGEVTEFKIERPCLEGSIGPVTGAGMLVRQCKRTGTVEENSVGNLRPSGAIAPVASIESPAGPLLGGPNGEVWIATNSGGYSKEPIGIARVAPDGSVQRFALPEQTTGRETVPEVRGLAIGKEGSLWAAVGYDGTTNPEWFSSIGGELVRIAPDGTMTEFQTPIGIEPKSLTLGPDGALWFTAVSGVSSSEHAFTRGKGYVGRMTTAGDFKTFEVSGATPTAIVAAPDGTLWFGADGTGQIGTISTSGQFGPHLHALGAVPTSFVFGPEGDLWAAGSSLYRLTPSGQRTSFGVGAGQVVLGPEGDIWADGFNRAWRVVPSAPGLDVWGLQADRKGRAAKLKLACGGSASACRGTVEITVPRVTKRPGQPRREWKPSTYLVGRRGYGVAAESSRTFQVKLGSVTRAIAARYGREHAGAGPTVTVTATVTGGPTMKRKVELRPAPRKPQAGSASDAK